MATVVPCNEQHGLLRDFCLFMITRFIVDTQVMQGFEVVIQIELINLIWTNPFVDAFQQTNELIHFFQLNFLILKKIFLSVPNVQRYTEPA